MAGFQFCMWLFVKRELFTVLLNSSLYPETFISFSFALHI